MWETRLVDADLWIASLPEPPQSSLHYENGTSREIRDLIGRRLDQART